MLVAYSPCGKKITTEKDVMDHHQWFLGTIIFHSYDITSIAPIEVRNDYYNKDSQSWSRDNNVENIEGAVFLRRGEFKLCYINVVEYKEETPGYHCMEASLLGPDKVPRTAEMKKLMQETRSSIKCLLPEGSLAVPSRNVGRSPLLDILYRYKGGKPNVTSRNKIKRRTTAAVGTHIVEIEGPIAKLWDGVDKKCLLVPLHHPNNNISSHSDSHVQQYVYLQKNTYKSLRSSHPQESNKMNQKLLMSSQKVVNLK